MDRMKDRTGFTLIEIVISILIVMVLATGAMGYQYYSTRDVRVSEVQTTAARLSMLLLEYWKGDEGSEDFDPASIFGSELTIDTSAFGPTVPEGADGMSLTLLGYYEIEVDGIYYYVTLSWDDASSEEPKILNAKIAWRSDYAQGELEDDEKYVQYSTFFVTN